MTDQPLRRILHRPDMSGRLTAWTIELSQFLIEYKPRSSLKSQVLSDFVTECQFSKPTQKIDPELSKTADKWSLYVDGSSTSNASGAGIILASTEGFVVKLAIKITFKATNNKAEYEAMLVGLKLANAIMVSEVDIYNDSLSNRSKASSRFVTKG